MFCVHSATTIHFTFHLCYFDTDAVSNEDVGVKIVSRIEWVLVNVLLNRNINGLYIALANTITRFLS